MNDTQQPFAVAASSKHAGPHQIWTRTSLNWAILVTTTKATTKSSSVQSNFRLVMRRVGGEWRGGGALHERPPNLRRQGAGSRLTCQLVRVRCLARIACKTFTCAKPAPPPPLWPRASSLVPALCAPLNRWAQKLGTSRATDYSAREDQIFTTTTKFRVPLQSDGRFLAFSWAPAGGDEF